jgi:hypothetical protein
MGLSAFSRYILTLIIILDHLYTMDGATGGCIAILRLLSDFWRKIKFLPVENKIVHIFLFSIVFLWDVCEVTAEVVVRVTGIPL